MSSSLSVRLKRGLLLTSSIALVALGVWSLLLGATPDPISFNQDIRPILNQKCVSCHGGVKQNGGLSFLFRKEALTPAESGLHAIVPYQPDSSELLKRIQHPDPEERMPLEASPLSEAEIEKFRRWIAEGAQWEDHWAFIKPELPAVPSVGQEWARSSWDPFIFAALAEKGLDPAPEADRATLIRRWSLDLIGLPPKPAWVSHFLQDSLPSAYERMVDTLLASPHYGEKWAAMWLDLARYADSKGYEKDDYRNIWAFRDWVIRAFNHDMPFDQFTIAQLAGDLLEATDTASLLATAFHRNTLNNDEGGTDDEEYRVAAVIDRVNTTFEVWQGITIGCVQCHHHPYDPFRHQEYYQLLDFFNQSADSDKPNEQPTLRYADPELTDLQDWFAEHAWAAHTPIMQELPDSLKRITQVFERGNWLVKGDTVQANVPATLPALPNQGNYNRLDLARWLVHPDNPLTARVMVNRLWEQVFGRGLVLTLEDFGTQGEAPSHPALLDFLALRFAKEQAWSIKSLLKEWVLSATYMQSSIVTAEKLAQDPFNIYLSRAPRIRLSAEQIRDQALAVSGLLSEKMYGPSVMPPQPEGIWQVVYNGSQWEVSEEEDRYRRGLYTYWRRTSPYPSMITFDSPSREFCVSRRIRTNTPLQALVTLNDPVYLEAALALAKQMLRHEETDEALAYAYQRVLVKSITPDEQAVLNQLYEDAHREFTASPQQAARLVQQAEAHSVRHAAMMVVANTILNLDACIVKE